MEKARRGWRNHKPKREFTKMEKSEYQRKVRKRISEEYIFQSATFRSNIQIETPGVLSLQTIWDIWQSWAILESGGFRE